MGKTLSIVKWTSRWNSQWVCQRFCKLLKREHEILSDGFLVLPICLLCAKNSGTPLFSCFVAQSVKDATLTTSLAFYGPGLCATAIGERHAGQRITFSEQSHTGYSTP